MPQDQDDQDPSAPGADGPRLDGLTVLHVAQPVDGGVARVVADLVRAQAAQGARVVVACPPGGDLGPAAADRGAQVMPWPARRSPGAALPAEVRSVARLIRAAGPDLLHLHSSKAGLAGRLAARGRVPTVFQPHAWSYDAVSGPAARAALRWERAATRWTHRVLCVSAAERDSGVRHGVRADWAVVPNGVDTARFRPPLRHSSARAALPALAGLDDETPLVVCVGRLCPQKGQDVLLRAWSAVVARLPTACLALVGDGPDRQRLLHDAPPGVLFAGAAADTLPWYQAADVVVQPSRWEGMALAPLEAMACARPVVATDVSGAREALPAADTELCVVPPEEPAALAGALLRLLTDPATRTATGLRALADVRARHDVRGTAAAVGALYTSLAPPPATRPSPLQDVEVPAR
ncbi:Glycosyltransferase involved in cell wall bisynthesis [Actinacidiphila yanglinensis]|uniref:Glycosyltransferase involved in cell wall bisynthesis n=1 Tax=Actinacidiphila yanglinensis TaxID=310779 RepID=A0A1H6AFW3_9ACTN|nr:glycosyltransferase family 4 protein [Actinacidiphila yanglinensis]SEG47252.1 Glycosyltransferase involved in cell wall bisynthesis [Actinacidiphila yanglinensis]